MVNLMDILVYSLVMQQSVQEIVPGILNHCTSKALGKQNIPLKNRRAISYRIYQQVHNFERENSLYASKVGRCLCLLLTE